MTGSLPENKTKQQKLPYCTTPNNSQFMRADENFIPVNNNNTRAHYKLDKLMKCFIFDIVFPHKSEHISTFKIMFKS